MKEIQSTSHYIEILKNKKYFLMTGCSGRMRAAKKHGTKLLPEAEHKRLSLKYTNALKNAV